MPDEKYVLPLKNILQGFEELRFTAEVWSRRCPEREFPKRPNKSQTPSLSAEEETRYEKALRDHFEYRLATHIEQAFGSLKSLLLSLEADARSLAREVLPVHCADTALLVEHLDAAQR
ncbi:MAG TPA: hypothetical protein VG122_08110 [Gemmata sp.]|jgi:hypothetical protein|nr:hypothetical protein [Gemmata sp.]